MNTRQTGYAHRAAIQSTVVQSATSVAKFGKKLGGIVGGYVAGFVLGLPDTPAMQAQKRNTKSSVKRLAAR